MMKQGQYSIGFLVLMLFSLPAFAANQGSNVACPVDTPYEDENGNPVSFEEKFGDGVLDATRCNKRRSNVKMVMQVNAYEQGGRPYGFRNLQNIINDFELTHAIANWKIAIVVHSGGNPFVLKGNTYEGMVSNFIANPNVDVYYCLNTAAALGHTTDDITDGVQFVPAGLSSIVDFQYQGYKYIQP